MKVTNVEIARALHAFLMAESVMTQAEAIALIRERFNGAFIEINRNGNFAIGKPVLDAFRSLSGEDIVWSRGGRLWRLREPEDDPGRAQI